MTTDAAPAVEIDGLRVVRGGRVVLDDLSLRLPAGRVIGLLGPSGCGKSTMLRSIVGVQIVERGTVSVLGSPAGNCALNAAAPAKVKEWMAATASWGFVLPVRIPSTAPNESARVASRYWLGVPSSMFASRKSARSFSSCSVRLNCGICRRPSMPVGWAAIHALSVSRAPSGSASPPKRFQTLPSSGAK